MLYNPFSLANKTILVTGASSGIGQTIAIECSKMGSDVVITARNIERLQETANAMGEVKHAPVIADLTNAVDIERLVEQVPELDGLVLCAGRALTAPVKQATPEKYLEVMNTNFFAQAELLRVLYKKKKLKNGSSVVIISSIGGLLLYEPGNVIYGASKAALNSFMKYAAKEYAIRFVRVNSICPGMIDTPMIHRGTFTDEQLQAYMANYPLKRFGKPEDIAYASIYLLSDAAGWMTGSSIIIDGGSTIKS